MHVSEEKSAAPPATQQQAPNTAPPLMVGRLTHLRSVVCAPPRRADGVLEVQQQIRIDDELRTGVVRLVRDDGHARLSQPHEVAQLREEEAVGAGG